MFENFHGPHFIEDLIAQGFDIEELDPTDEPIDFEVGEFTGHYIYDGHDATFTFDGFPIDIIFPKYMF